MTRVPTLLILAGDGIGPEVMAATEVVIEALRTKADFHVTITHDLVGGASIDAHGVPVTDAVVAQAAERVIRLHDGRVSSDTRRG